MENVSPLNLNEPCVLVLGAGASEPYGFPLGVELKYSILKHQKDFANALRGIKQDAALVSGFIQSLKHSQYSTIDLLLEKMPRFRELGSYFIAHVLMPREDHDRLFQNTDWYTDLFDILDFENGAQKIHNLSIVTLNYDRSLEYFLHKNLDYNCSDAQRPMSLNKIAAMKIVHAHGSLGKYPNIPFDIDIKVPAEFATVASGIKIVSDKIEDTDDFKLAQEIIAQAKHVIFLGFGYHQVTLQRLLAKSEPTNQKYYGSGYDLSDQFTQQLKDLFDRNYGSKIMFGSRGDKCRQFLQMLQMLCR